MDLFIGSEGTLGIVSEVAFRLMPVDESRLVFLQCLASADQAFALVEAIRADAALRTTALEFLDARSHELARETRKLEVERVLAHAPAGSCSVFAEFGYHDEAALEAAIARVAGHVAAAGGDEAAGLAGVDDRVLHDIRTFRHAVPERINATIARRREQHPALHKVATDMAVEDKDLRWVYDLYSSRLTASGLDHAIFGHVGNNHFHVNILPKDEAELLRAKGIYAEIRTGDRRPWRMRFRRARHRANQETIPGGAVRRGHARCDARREALARSGLAAESGCADRSVRDANAREPHGNSVNRCRDNLERRANRPSGTGGFLEAYTDASSASPRGVLPPFRPFATSIADSSAVSWAS